MSLSKAMGFAKQAAGGSFLGRAMSAVGRGAANIIKKPAVWKGGLALSAGAAGGAYLHSQLQKSAPLEPGALTREKRRGEIDRFGSM